MPPHAGSNELPNPCSTSRLGRVAYSMGILLVPLSIWFVMMADTSTARVFSTDNHLVLSLSLACAFIVLDFLRIAAAKVLQDVKNTGPTRDLFTYFVSKFLGGKVQNHSITSVHNITQFVFAGTPVTVFRHFYQIMKTGRFTV